MHVAFTVICAALSISALAQDQRVTEDPLPNVEEMTWVEAMQDYRVNFHTVVEKFNSVYDGVPYEKGHGWKQFKRWEYMMGQRVGESGVRPHPGVLYQAILQQSSSLKYGDWSAIGPFNAPGNDGIGRINHITFHPNHADTIYAGAPAGGLWVSYDNGQSWETHTDNLTNIGVSDLAIDPNHPDTMYLATGDRDAADTYSFGLLKSTDGGLTWNTTGLSFGLTQGRRIARVRVHPDSSNRVIVAARNGMYLSTNYGQTFSLVKSGSFNSLAVSSSPDTMYASTTGSTSKVYRSINGGTSWSQLTGGLPTSGLSRAEVAVSPQDPTVVYALYGNSGQGYKGLYRSTDAGNSWTLKSSSPNIFGWQVNGSGTGGQAWYDLSLAVNPTDTNTVYVGGVNIWKSTDGGANWSIVGHWYGASGTPFVHADHHFAAFRPGSTELYACTDGGVFKTANGGSSWTALYDGLNITQYYKISHSQQDTSVVLAGAQDNGTHLRSTTQNWSRATGGDGMDNAVSPFNDDIMFSSIYYGDFYKSTNGGSWFSSISTLTPAGTGNWVTPLKYSPNTQGKVFAGFKRLWKSTNDGSSWSATSTGNISGNSNIDEFEVAPGNDNIIYVAINQNIYKTTNGGTSWSSVTGSGSMAPGNNITGISINASNNNHVVYSVSGYNGSKKVFETLNAGQTWTNITGSLPNVPANCVIFEGGSMGGIYVGTDIGVFYRNSGMSDWVNFSKHLPNVIINDLEIYEDYGILRAGTYGRGVYQSELFMNSIGAPTASLLATPSTTCSVGDTVTLEDQSAGMPTRWKWEIFPAGATFVGGTSDSDQVAQVVFSAAGNYHVKLYVENAVGNDDTLVSNAIGVGGATLPFVEDFETGMDGWTVNNPDGSTTWGVTSVGGSTPGSNAVYMDHYNYSSTGAEDDLISPAFNFSNDTNITLTFDHAYALYSASYKDTLEVYASSDCGSTWTLLATYTEDGTGNWETVGTSSSVFVPATAADWCGGTSNASCKVINLDAYSGMTGVKVKFTSVNGYSNNLYLDNINITSTAKNAPTASFFGDTLTCAAQQLNFTSTSTDATSLTWLFPGGTPATSSDVSPMVSYSAAGTYDVTLIATNSAGSDTVTQAGYVTITPSMLASVTLSSDTLVACSGDSTGVTLAVQNGGNAPQFSWTLNGQPVSTSNSAFGTNAFTTGDVLVVQMTSNDPCVTQTTVYDTTYVVVHSKPNTLLSSLGSVCSNADSVLLNQGTPVGGVYSGNGVVGNYFFPTQVSTGMNLVTYTYTDPSTGCSKSRTKSMNVQAAPAVPTVSQNSTGELVVAPPAGLYTYQWIDANGTPISGATGQSYMPTANGFYACEITSNIQCTTPSAFFEVTNIGLDEIAPNEVNIYPTPAHSSLTVEVGGTAEVQMIDATGRTVWTGSVSGETTVDVSQFARGAYLVKVVMENNVITLPVVLN